MASKAGSFPPQSARQKRYPELGKVVNTSGRRLPASDLPRRSERLRQQPLTDGELPRAASQTLLRKRMIDAHAEQRAERARLATDDGFLPAHEPMTNTEFESAPFMPHTESREREGQKRRRTDSPIVHNTEETVRKRQRISLGESVAGDIAAEELTDESEDDWRAMLRFWLRERQWPKAYFQDCQDMDHLLARKESNQSLSRKRSESTSSATPSDQRPREERSVPYKDPRYEVLLEIKGIYMDESPIGITETSKELCKTLLETEVAIPENSLFRNDIFEATCRKLRVRNEAKVIQDISRLLVPSAETFTIYNPDYLKNLIESVNEGWNNSVPLTGTRPQPDYSVGFRREAFSDGQQAKLAPFIGNWLGGDQSFFMGTYYMFFPFLACEVKCGAAALDVADRQNAHSMTLAARAVFELFRLVGREAEVDRQILSLSISHDHRSVRIYGYYPVIEDKDTKYYRHPISEFHFAALHGKEKWTAYRFTKNVYNTWMPLHFERICSAIDQLPSNIDFSVDPLPATGLSQGMESLSEAAPSQSPVAPADPSIMTPESSLRGAAAFKKSKKNV